MNPSISRLLLTILIASPLLLVSNPAGCAAEAAAWKDILSDRTQLFGHRNWIVIVDSAYPAQSRDGIETSVTGAGQLEVLRQVLDTLEGMKHVRPTAYTDAELPHVSEQDAPGIDSYRKDLAKALRQRPVLTLPHEGIIAKLDEAAKVFRVLILKTNSRLPYTSIFLELDCGYWNSDAEKRLRQSISKPAGN
jgi:hypothetical protein